MSTENPIIFCEKILNILKDSNNKYLGVDFLRQDIGNYIISASAAKHLVRVRRVRNNSSQEEILFDGLLVIYKEDRLVIGGRIWYAQKPTPQLEGKGGLQFLLFGKEERIPELEQRITKIIEEHHEQNLNIISPSPYNYLQLQMQGTY